MRRTLLFVLAAAAFLAGCSGITPEAGQEAVITRHPWIFGQGGVDPNPVLPGRKWIAWTTDYQIVNMQPQLFLIHFDDFMSKDGVPLDFDVALRLQITESVKMVKDFGVGPVELVIGGIRYSYPKWYVNNVHKNLENAVRQSVRRHGMNETAISTVAIDEIDAEISKSMQGYIEEKRLPVKLVDFTVGRANPPDAIKNQRIETATQEQRINTEKQRKLAEDQRKEAEIARAAADNAFRNALQLSPEQYLRLESLKVQREVCVKEGGRCTFVYGGAMPTIDVGKH